jgi:hypothetical protein
MTTDNRSDESSGKPSTISWRKDGKPPKVLSTTLGLVLLAGSAGSMGASAAAPSASPSPSPSPSGGQPSPVLVEWSTEEVKAFYDPVMDWNLPELQDQGAAGAGSASSAGSGSAPAGSGGTTIIHQSGFGWDDLLLYHLIFNRGSSYSASSWGASHPSYYASTGKVYNRTSYDENRFQNRPTTGSSIRPKTTTGSGSITRRSTSSSTGSIGGKSSGFSSSSSFSGKSSGGFGG